MRYMECWHSEWTRDKGKVKEIEGGADKDMVNNETRASFARTDNASDKGPSIAGTIGSNTRNRISILN